MGSRSSFDKHVLRPGLFEVAGSFQPNGTGVPAKVEGAGWSVVRTSAGLFTVTFEDKFIALHDLQLGIRNASGSAVHVQGGDFSQANRTLQIRVLAETAIGAGAGFIPLSLADLMIPSQTKNVVVAQAGDLVLDGTNPPTLTEVASTFAYKFDNDLEEAGFNFRVPDDWDGVSDITMNLVWHPQSGTAIADTEVVRWDAVYYATKAGEAVDNGTPVTASGTHTQSGAGTDKEEIRTGVTLDYDHADQPLARGDTVSVHLTIDDTASTYITADTTGPSLVRVELQYTKQLERVGQHTTPRLERVNGGTDPALRLVWPAGNVDPVQFPPVPKPADLDAASDLTARIMALMSGSTDTTTAIDMQFYDGIGDTEAGALTGAGAADLTDTLAEHFATIANANLAAHPGFMNFLMVPEAHANDDVHVHAAWLEYAKNITTAFQLADLTLDADTVVNFQATFRNVQYGKGV